MHRFWFWIGPIPVRTYSTLFLAAFLIGFGVTLYFAKARRKGHLTEHLWNLAPLLFLGGLAGSRFWQVVFFDAPYYWAHPAEILAVWNGGLSIQGGVVGSLVTGWLYARKHGLRFWELADLAAPGLILGQSIGRDANLLNGDAFGSPTGGDFGLLYPHGTIARIVYGDRPLWPSEVWEGQGDLIIFGLLILLLFWEWPEGWLFLIETLLYAAERFALEALRGDSPRFLFGWDAAQWTSAAVAAIAVAAMVRLARRPPARSGAG